MPDLSLKLGVELNANPLNTGLAAIVSTVNEATADMKAAFTSLRTEPVLQETMEQAHVAAGEFFSTINAGAPRAASALSVTARSIQTELAAAFSPVVVVRFLLKLIEVINTLHDFWNLLSGIRAERKKTDEEDRKQANDELELRTREIKAAYELQIARAAGIEKERLRLDMARALVNVVGNEYIPQLIRQKQVLEQIRSEEEKRAQEAYKAAAKPGLPMAQGGGPAAAASMVRGFFRTRNAEAASQELKNVERSLREAEVLLKQFQANQINAENALAKARDEAGGRELNRRVQIQQILTSSYTRLNEQIEQDDQNRARSLDSKLQLELRQEKAANDQRLAELQRQRDVQQAIAEEEIAHQERMALMELEDRRFSYEAQLRDRRKNSREVINDELRFLAEEHRIRLKALNDKLKLLENDPDLNAKELKRLHDKVAEENRRFENEQNRVKERELTRRQRLERGAAQAMQTAFSESIQAMVFQTESLAQVWRRVLQSIVAMLADELAKILMRWIETHVLMKIFGIQQTSATNQAKASSDAAVAAAGQFAYYSEVFPPIAPAMAAAAFAQGMAWATLAGTLALAEKGALLDQDQLVYAHKNEMILPAPLSAGLQKMVGLGVAPSPALRMPVSAAAGTAGPVRAPAIRNEHYNFNANISTIDAKGTAQWMRENSGIFYRLIRDGVRAGKLRPAEI